MTTPEHKTLNAILACQMAVFAMDELQGTPDYRHGIKQKGNAFLKEAEAYTSQQTPRVFGVQDDVMYQLMDYQKNFIRAVLKLRPEDMGVIGEIVVQYIENPEAVLQALGMAFKGEIIDNNVNVEI